MEKYRGMINDENIVRDVDPDTGRYMMGNGRAVRWQQLSPAVMRPVMLQVVEAAGIDHDSSAMFSRPHEEQPELRLVRD
jgi:hypothetical protein